MGTGDGPFIDGYFPANALWVIDSATFGGPRPQTRDGFVAWPPKGYVPYQLFSPRWSFSYPGADFSAAAVTMQRNGSTVPVMLQPVANGYGENTFVWVIDNLDVSGPYTPVKPANDTTISVTISNVLISGAAQTFMYDVILL